MAGALRTLGLLVLMLGLAVGAVAGMAFIRDAEFTEVAAAYARHPDHALFRAEYLSAAARHYGLLAASLGGLLGGLATGGLLLGIGELLRRVPPGSRY